MGLFVGAAWPLRPSDGHSASPPVASADLLALRGFDVVTYFLDGAAPRPGRADLEWAWKGRAWRFVSAANRTVFREAPATYAPRLDGFDPVAMAQGRLVEADPLVFARLPFGAAEPLYLFRHDANRAAARQQPGIVAEAEARWPSLRGLIDLRFPD
ncbi:hypothetical protein ASG40_05500 [Methylobacterium sp. Leaf399]|uniref:hypothetical protein n=1 Tax=Methylobacterium sp. Leaf399 TaxID=1736364 RepID=UPI0006F25E5D|nr:hypothetical protein [Methylobacterium sp. Leaf399]KQT14761.1 hypothetical protein ASG40_05500 [Methylobacterium sp. Leaf399]